MRSTRRLAATAPIVYLRSDKDAPNRRVIAIDLRDPKPSTWKIVVPEQKQVIETVSFIGGRIVAQYLVDVQSRLRMFGPDGAEAGEIALPGIGTVGGLTRTRRSARHLVRVQLAADAHRRSIATIRRPRQSASFEAPTPPVDTSQFETLALFATSKDGTRVPFFLDREEEPAEERQPIRRCSTATAAFRSARCRPTAPTCRRGSSAAACG